MYDQVETIYKAIEFIESHLQSEINIAQIAESVGYSTFHFLRTFNRVVHHTPYDYLIRRRLSEAAHTLTGSDRRITDISQDFGFNNQESFSRAFKRMFDIQPRQWRNEKLEVPSLLMPPLTFADLHFINRESFQYPVIEEFKQITLYGLMAALDAEEQIQHEQRSRMFSDLCELSSNPSRFIAVTSYMDQDWRSAYCFIGVEDSTLKSVNPSLVMKMLPAGRYASITAAESDRSAAFNYLYYTWFPRTRLKPAAQIEIEMISFDKNKSPELTFYIPVDLAQSETSNMKLKP